MSSRKLSSPKMKATWLIIISYLFVVHVSYGFGTVSIDTQMTSDFNNNSRLTLSFTHPESIQLIKWGKTEETQNS